MTDHPSTMDRRAVIKASAVAATTAAAGLPAQALAQAATAGKSDGIRWDKGVCRFCGTGCGVLVGTKNGRVVATQGDPDARSIAASTASRAISSPRSCMARTG